MVARDATADRVVESVIPAEVLHGYAVGKHVCVRPLLREVMDRETGDVQRLMIPCGSTREAVCPACAEKARRLRTQQCAEGWHL
jgi:replication initiator protein RepSA